MNAIEIRNLTKSFQGDVRRGSPEYDRTADHTAQLHRLSTCSFVLQAVYCSHSDSALSAVIF